MGDDIWDELFDIAAEGAKWGILAVCLLVLAAVVVFQWA